MTEPNDFDQVRPRRRRRLGVAGWSFTIGLLLLVALAFVPSPYVIREPGPTFNAIGEATIRMPDGTESTQQVITINDPDAHVPSSGALTVMTVSIVGSPSGRPTWLQALAAWLNPQQDVVPIETYFPEGTSPEQRDAETAAMMQQSQDTAVAAALTRLGYEVDQEVVVTQVAEDGASTGLLQPGDVVTAVNGSPVSAAGSVREALSGTDPATIAIVRDGVPGEVTVTPRMGEVDGEQRPLLGIVVQGHYDFPIDISIELGDVGGPSGGLIYSLAITDELTSGDLTHGKVVAGTGTMAPDGTVGPIGGIRQKLFAANAIGAEFFVAPVDNCAEAVDGPVPSGLPVYAVSTLDEAVSVVDRASAGDTSGLRTCADVVAAGGGHQP